MTDRPNFLFIITDQHRADHVGCYGNDIVQTPHIDGIAARGTRFDKFYVANGTCMPNRATLMTGRMPSVTGVITNGQPLPLDSNTFVDTLRATGYRTALFGKSHLQNMADMEVDDSNFPPARPGATPPASHRDSYLTPRATAEYQNERRDIWQQNPDHDVIKPYYGFEEVKLSLGHADKVWGHYMKWLGEQHSDPDSLGGPANGLPADGFDAPQVWRTNMPEELYPNSYVERMTTDYLEGYAKSGSDAPFFIQCSFPDPHHPFTPPGQYFDMYKPSDVDASPSLGADHVDPCPLTTKLENELSSGSRELRVAAFACTENEARQYVALTYGMISQVDDCVGRVLAKLDELGMAENTVVIFTSDHGDLMSDHGLMLKHCYHQEGIIHVPFIWSDPDQAGTAPAATDTMGSTLDIGACVLARAGISAYFGMQGQDVVGDVQAGRTPDRLGLMIEEDELPFNCNTDTYMRTRTFVTDRWRLTYWHEYGFGEMFDRQEDPLEIVNRWNDPAAKADKAELLEMMMRERVALDDLAPRAAYCA